jgi:hypothetical protein
VTCGPFTLRTESGLIIATRLALLKVKTALEEMLRDAGHLVEKCLDLSEKSFDFACTAHDRFIKGGCEVKKEIHCSWFEPSSERQNAEYSGPETVFHPGGRSKW